MPRPKIMIGVPGFAGVHPKAQENFFALAFACGRRMPDYDFLLKIVIKKEQFRARNNLVDLAIANGCDYLLMLDDDMLVSSDLVQKLLAHDKDVIGALYWQRGGSYNPVIIRDVPHEDGSVGIDFYLPHDPIIRDPGLYEVDIIGGGCMLLKVDIFRKILPPYFWWEAQEGTDVAICRRLREAGVSVWIDTSIELGHIGEETVVTSRTIPAYSHELGRIREQLFEDLMVYTGETAEGLQGALLSASHRAHRKDEWGVRDTWEKVRDFYIQPGLWKVLNLGYWNMRSGDFTREYALTDMAQLARTPGRILDYGPGIGVCVIPLAHAGYHVTAVELAGAPTLDFLRWRVDRHSLGDRVEILEFADPYPAGHSPEPFDAALMISVMNHLWEPYKSVQWVNAHLKQRGYLICDWQFLHNDDEPQHIMKYDVHQFEHWMKDQGLRCTPERPYVFYKE